MYTNSTPTPNKTQAVKIYAGSRIVGTVEGATFRKVVSGSKHFFRNPPGLGADITSLGDAEKAGAAWVQVTDRESGYTYTAQIKSIFEKGIPRDFGFGKQLILPFKFWSMSKGVNQPAEQLAFSATATTPSPVFGESNTTGQLNLFTARGE
jgi:hypothetical protein